MSGTHRITDHHSTIKSSNTGIASSCEQIPAAFLLSNGVFSFSRQKQNKQKQKQLIIIIMNLSAVSSARQSFDYSVDWLMSVLSARCLLTRFDSSCTSCLHTHAKTKNEMTFWLFDYYLEIGRWLTIPGRLPTPKLLGCAELAKQAYDDQKTRAVTYSHSHLDIHDDTSTRTRQNRPFKKWEDLDAACPRTSSLLTTSDVIQQGNLAVWPLLTSVSPLTCVRHLYLRLTVFHV